MSAQIDLTGQKFNRLTAVLYIGHGKWLCRCDCGSDSVTTSGHLRRGTVKSCGCARDDASRSRAKHGASHNTEFPEYVSWAGMRQRCTNPKNHKYPDYGGRGIRYDARWDDFLVFLADMGRMPTRNHTLDRRDVNGHYEPSNCRWATDVEQANNRRPRRRGYDKRLRGPDGQLVEISDMTPAEFSEIFDGLSLTQTAFAPLIDRSRKAVARYATGAAPVPKDVADVMRALRG